jgi:enoyl-CoA hydratase
MTAASLPAFETIALTRQGRRLTITLNRPEARNAANLAMHQELPAVFLFAADDPHSDVVVLTGAGDAFSAGGDLDHIENFAARPAVFDNEARVAKRIFLGLLDIEKPVVCRMNGHAIGLGATLALLCDVVFAAEGAVIADPHVKLGLVAGDGGAVIWTLRVGLGRAKEFLLTGDPVPAKRAEEIGLVNYCLPAAELDAAVDAFCDRLLAGASRAMNWTKALMNMEVRRIASGVLEAGVAYEAVSVRTAELREGVRALRERRRPEFGEPEG